MRGKQTPLATFVKDINGVLIKHQKNILNCWREYFCQLLNSVTVQHLETSEEQFGEEIYLTEAEVSKAIKSLKTEKAPGKGDIRPKRLRTMNNFVVRRLTRVFLVAWKIDEVPKQWQTMIPINKKGDKKKCTNYRDIFLLRFPVKVYTKCLEKRCRKIVEPQLQDTQCGFRPGRSTIDQTFALQQVFLKLSEYAQELYTCFIDLEKAYDHVPRDKLWAVLLEYDVRTQLIATIKSLYKQSEICVRVDGTKAKPFRHPVHRSYQTNGVTFQQTEKCKYP